MKKALKIIGISIGSLIGLVAVFLAVWFLWPWNSAFFKNATKEFSIPGLDTDFVPQAFTKIDGQNTYIVGGYMSKGSASRYYVINSETGTAEKYFTLKVDGEDYVGHACGIASSGDNLWICSKDEDEGRAYRFTLSSVTSVENGGSINIVDYFATNNGADNITVSDGYLWVGEFYREGNYETADNHRIATRDNQTNTAVAYAYEIDNTATYGVVDTIPDKALSMTGLVQGMAFSTDGKIVLSTSYSLPDSTIYTYDAVLSETAHSTISVGGTDVDLWFLDNESLIKEVNAPAMTEEIVIDNNKLYVLSESACQKYKIFNRKKLQNIYSLSLDFIFAE